MADNTGAGSRGSSPGTGQSGTTNYTESSESTGIVGRVREQATSQLNTQKNKATDGLGTVARYAGQIERVSRRLRTNVVGELMQMPSGSHAAAGIVRRRRLRTWPARRTVPEELLAGTPVRRLLRRRDYTSGSELAERGQTGRFGTKTSTNRMATACHPRQRAPHRAHARHRSPAVTTTTLQPRRCDG